MTKDKLVVFNKLCDKKSLIKGYTTIYRLVSKITMILFIFWIYNSFFSEMNPVCTNNFSNYDYNMKP